MLGLVPAPNTYEVITGNEFILPNQPTNLPVIPQNATAAQINETVRQHKEALRVWREIQSCEKALKQQLISAVDPIYLTGLHNRHTGYGNSTTLQMITYL